jgi:hypothetical protein
VPTSIDRNSKPDTVFLCLPAGGGAAALATDASQNRTALTNNTTYVSEANSARTALSSPRELTIVVEIASGQSGVLVYHGNAGGYGYRVRINAGAVEVYKASGVTLKKWITAGDAAVREVHVEIDGKTVPIGDSFVEGAVLRYPGDLGAPAPLVVNCRCSAAPEEIPSTE